MAVTTSCADMFTEVCNAMKSDNKKFLRSYFVNNIGEVRKHKQLSAVDFSHLLNGEVCSRFVSGDDRIPREITNEAKKKNLQAVTLRYFVMV